VESEPGVGTTFRLRLPISRSMSPTRTGDSGCTSPADSRQARILVAEDESIVRYFLERVLKRSGFDVLLAADGKEALEKFHSAPDGIDLMLLDVVMPDLNGTEVAEQVRGEDPQVPIVFCTGYAPNSPEVAAALREGTPIVRKPVNEDQLLRVIKSQLAGISSSQLEEQTI
jgi:CheY-like chemotaxis protein